MFQACRPAGRLFYLVLALVVTASGVRSAAREASGKEAENPTSSPKAKSRAVEPTPRAASPAPQGGLMLTSVIEVRENDYGWGQANERNLLGRFNSQAFTMARLAQTQNYFLRLYDSSSPPKYSRYSAALHVDYPL